MMCNPIGRQVFTDSEDSDDDKDMGSGTNPHARVRIHTTTGAHDGVQQR